jgi:cell division protein FtsI (penicillin-binding protein 3)
VQDSDAFRRSFRARMALAAALFSMAGLALIVRAVDLQFLEQDFFQRQGDARQIRVVEIAAHRGSITDRRGEPLAVSSPVDSVWVNPSELRQAPAEIPRLAAAVSRDPEWLMRAVSADPDRQFMYLRRHLSPDEARKITGLGIPGVYTQREYRRFYPAGEVAGHVIGFTDIDEAGQEGLELAYEHWLRGEPGAKRIRRDRLGNVIEDVESIREPAPGRDLRTSLDLRLQYLAYRELKAAVQNHRAKAGSMVILDIASGEVLAMVNQPSYNPNDRAQLSADRYRNRATNDIFEPGSTVKPFIVAAALESGRYNPASVVDTNPGWMVVGAKTIEDHHNLGLIDLTTLISRSSNVGAATLALALDPEQLWSLLRRLGLGEVSATGFPGESAGVLMEPDLWKPISQATLSYGYGLSATPLQMAHAYSVLGAGGLNRPTSLLALDVPPEPGRVLSETTSRAVVRMMEAVVQAGGTATKAAIPGYRVAGKTGTAKKFTAGGYHEDRYISAFAGVAPASDPRLAAVVVIDEPSTGDYYGGEVAAPVFARVVGDSLRILGVPPDDGGETRSVGDLVQAMRQR